MNKYQKSLDRIALNFGFNCLGCKYDKALAEDISNMQELVNLATPTKPVNQCTPVVRWGVCPRCEGKLNTLGRSVERVFVSNNYCPSCGQALDWSGEELNEGWSGEDWGNEKAISVMEKWKEWCKEDD